MCIRCVAICVGTCIGWYCTSGIDGCTMLYTGYRCMCYTSGVRACISWCCVSSVVVCVCFTLCICATGREGIGHLLGVTTDSVLI